MIIGVIGSGGREHAICEKILQSKKLKNYIVSLETLERTQ